MKNKPKRVLKSGLNDNPLLYLPEGFRPTEIGIKDLHREYHSNSERSDLDVVSKVKQPKKKLGGKQQRIDNSDKINALQAKKWTLAKQGKEKPIQSDLNVEKLQRMYNLTSGKKPLTLAQFRTKAKQRSFQNTLRQLASHQY